MALFAQLDNFTRVTRVVVCDTIEYLEQRLGGIWVETVMDDPVQQYAGPGMYQSDACPPRFVPAWVQPTGAQDAYEVGVWVWHNDLVWENLTPANVFEPGVTGWRDPLNEWPEWVQPLGAQDAYPLGAKVTFQGSKYISLIPANVWSPTVYPAGWQIQP